VVPNCADLSEVDAALRQLLAGQPLHESGEGEHWISQWHEWQAERAAVAGQVASLTPRERAVTRLMYAGKGVREISEELEVTEATVRSHVKAVLRKFRVGSQLGAVALLARQREDCASLQG
jgi:DNA-binding NarL/FixJ family response regulator